MTEAFRNQIRPFYIINRLGHGKLGAGRRLFFKMSYSRFQSICFGVYIKNHTGLHPRLPGHPDQAVNIHIANSAGGSTVV